MSAGGSAVMLCVCFRGGISGSVGSCAGGGSHRSSAVDRVCVAVEEQVSKPDISFTSGNKAFKNVNETNISGAMTVLCSYCDTVHHKI